MRCTEVARRAIRAAIEAGDLVECHRLARLYPREVPTDAPAEVREAVERARRNDNGPDP